MLSRNLEETITKSLDTYITALLLHHYTNEEEKYELHYLFLNTLGVLKKYGSHYTKKYADWYNYYSREGPPGGVR